MMKRKSVFFCLMILALLLFPGGSVWADDGLFSALIDSGRRIFEDLRELIYIAAGFGIIAVGVGGIFGNLNWKWLGAIIVSLVVIATAGELIYVMVGKTPVGNTTNENDNALCLTGGDC